MGGYVQKHNNEVIKQISIYMKMRKKMFYEQLIMKKENKENNARSLVGTERHCEMLFVTCFGHARTMYWFRCSNSDFISKCVFDMGKTVADNCN